MSNYNGPTRGQATLIIYYLWVIATIQLVQFIVRFPS